MAEVEPSAEGEGEGEGEGDGEPGEGDAAGDQPGEGEGGEPAGEDEANADLATQGGEHAGEEVSTEVKRIGEAKPAFVRQKAQRSQHEQETGCCKKKDGKSHVEALKEEADMVGNILLHCNILTLLGKFGFAHCLK